MRKKIAATETNSTPTKSSTTCTLERWGRLSRAVAASASGRDIDGACLGTTAGRTGGITDWAGAASVALVETAPVEAAPVEAAPVEAAPVEAAPVEFARTDMTTGSSGTVIRPGSVSYRMRPISSARLSMAAAAAAELASNSVAAACRRLSWHSEHTGDFSGVWQAGQSARSVRSWALRGQTMRPACRR
ncbi:hypothetical protein E3N85_00945 [Cryobacterium sp. Hz9]|nr:hypothetical protein E3N85_00945 [Cryobacterium sp. Hz9]